MSGPTPQMISALPPFGSYTFPMFPKTAVDDKRSDNNSDADIASSSSSSNMASAEGKRIGRFIHMDFTATDNCWYYAVNRTPRGREKMLHESPYEVILSFYEE